MSPLHALQLALAAAAGAAALLRRECRPITAYLGAVVVLDALRLGLAQLLPPGPAPREGTALLLRHASQAAYLALILALPAMAMVLFLRRRPWPVAWAYGGALLMLVATYPKLRGAELLRAYSALEAVGGLAAAGCFVGWLRRREPPSLAIACGLALVSASLATVALPQLLGPGTLERWPVVMAVHAVGFAVVLALQLWGLTSAAPSSADQSRSPCGSAGPDRSDPGEQRRADRRPP